MSQTPDEARRSFRESEYERAYKTVNDLILEGHSWSGRERHCGFLNTGQQRFADISAVSGFDLIDDGRAVAVVDWDHDGDLDCWTTNRTSPQIRFLRNDYHGDQHFLMVRLTGTESNRDAIGARVEVVAGDPEASGGGQGNRSTEVEPGTTQNSAVTTDESKYDAHQRRFIRTVRAGEGFLAQSSKWLHFGLGKHRHVRSITVRWPSGRVEQFTDIAVDRRYQILEGRGELFSEDSANRKTILQPSVPDRTPPAGRARIVLKDWPQAPTVLDYIDLDGQTASLHNCSQGPLLVNVWASWCQPCVRELHELAAHEKEFRAAGLDVIALSVDSLDEKHATDGAGMRSVLAGIGYRFQAGWVTPELAEKLNFMQNAFVLRRQPLSLPTSYLMTSDGRVAVVYRGPVSARELLSDIQLLRSGELAEDDHLVPIAGRWHAVPAQTAAAEKGEVRQR